MSKVSTAPFERMGQIEIIAHARKMQREKGNVVIEAKTPKATLDATIRRLSAQFTDPGTEVEVEVETRRRMEQGKLKAAQERAAGYWTDAGVPERHRERLAFEGSADGKRWQAALERARKAIAANGQIAFIGTFGSGKTQMAVELIREATSSNRTALFTTATKFLRAIKACYRDEAKTTEADILSQHVKPHLLVIDEFHRRKGSDWENEQLFDVINERYNAMKPMIIICNQSREQFDATMDGAILDRMNETGGVIECNWGSFRG
jgi:DNA replication protein DnaC